MRAAFELGETPFTGFTELPPMNLTRHASGRTQKRAVPRFILQLLLDHGATEHDHRGGVIHFFDKRSLRRIESELGRAFFRCLDRHLFDAYAVVVDGEIVTAGYRTKRILRGIRGRRGHPRPSPRYPVRPPLRSIGDGDDASQRNSGTFAS